MDKINKVKVNDGYKPQKINEGYQPTKVSERGYQPVNNCTTKPTPPTTGSVIIKTNNY